MKTPIIKDGASIYYLVNEGMGGFMNPPEDAEHDYSIIEVRGGHEVASYSLSCACHTDYLPKAVKLTARKTLNAHRSKITEEWIKSVYSYFKHCYSPDGVDQRVDNSIVYGKFWGNADQEASASPNHHLGYLFVKKFDANHTPRIDLINA